MTLKQQYTELIQKCEEKTFTLFDKVVSYSKSNRIYTFYNLSKVKELYNNLHTFKEIRKEHNVYKMLIAGSFSFKSYLNTDEEDKTLEFINNHYNLINKKDEVMSKELSDEWCSVDHIIANALSGK